MKKLVVSTGVLVTTILVFGTIGLATTGSPGAVASLQVLQDERVMFIEDHDLYLVYFQDRVLALDADAQHLGDDVVFCESSQWFESPAHGEKFDLRGYHVGGPAARGLTRYPVQILGDGIYVDVEHPVEGPERHERMPLPPRGPLCVPT